MILLADSGSSKTDWRLVSSGQVLRSFRTEGINPTMQSAQQIDSAQTATIMTAADNNLAEVHFFGAGCALPHAHEKLVTYFKGLFPQASVEVGSDLLGAAKALFGQETGLVCILGTGANSGYYDGERIIKNIPSLGYLLGDEGSGMMIGRRILVDLLRDNLPQNLKKELLIKLTMDENEILQHVYEDKWPNRFLASLVKTTAQCDDNGYLSDVVEEELGRFFKHIINLYDRNGTSLGFVGSIAFHFQDILLDVASRNGHLIGRILKNPIDQLVQFYV